MLAANLRRAERDVRRTGAARCDDPAGLLVGVTGCGRRRRPRGRAAARAGHARAPARAAHRLRGAGLGPVRQHVRACLADRPAGRPSRARPVPRQLPRPFPRRRPGRDQGRARRQGVPPPTRRRAADEHGRGRVEPPSPPVPRAGLVRPRRLRRPRADDGLRRPAVARGVQRRLPAGRPTARRHRRHALAARAAGGGGHVGAAGRSGSPPAGRPAAGAPARRTRLHRARGGLALRSGRGAFPDRTRFRPHRPAPLQAGGAVGAGPGAGPAELRATQRGCPGDGGDLRAGHRERRPGGIGPPRRTTARPGAAAPAPTRGSGAHVRRRARRNRRLPRRHRPRQRQLAPGLRADRSQHAG